MPGRPHVLVFCPTVDGMDAAGKALRDLLDREAVPEAARYRIDLVFDEVAVNIIRYASASSDVELRVTLGEGEILLAFEDDGIAFDPRTHVEAEAPTLLEEAKVGGLGIGLIRRMSARIDYERTSDGRNRLTLAIPRDGDWATEGA
jgi:anti-sigma regulatory factor (Ser/Thr protein kinase)